jgi:hypothetical protein
VPLQIAVPPFSAGAWLTLTDPTADTPVRPKRTYETVQADAERSGSGNLEDARFQFPQRRG